MNVVDSSGWLEYFADTPRADLFAPAIENTAELLVPVLCIYEVFKKVLREQGEAAAASICTQMQQGQVITLNLPMALAATRHALPMADSLIYATARQHKATLWTQDAHFKDLPGVRYFAKP